MKVGGICGECNKYYEGESCPKCKTIETGNTVNVILDIPEHFNRGLGEVVRGRAEYNAKLKEKGLIEVGNEKRHVDPEKMRANKEREQDKVLASIRPEAHKMLSYYEERSQWN